MLISNTLRIAILAAVAVFSAIGMAKDEPEFGLAGSKHDFVRLGVSKDQRCTPCHVPQRTEAESPGALWDDSADSTRRYKLYGGSLGVPGAASMVCLSCHDGSQALDAFGGMNGEFDLGGIATPSSVIGRDYDLTGDHPVGIAYPDFDRNYRSKAAIEGAGFIPLPEGRVECVSCHDPHGQYGIPNLLVKSNVRSALCLTCHRK